MNATTIATSRVAGTPLRSVAVELFDGSDFDAATWPTIGSRPGLEMNVFQCREFLGLWMRTVGRARQARTYLAVVRERGGRPVLYLPLAIERHFNVSLLRFPDAGLADSNAPILAAGRSLTPHEFASAWGEVLRSLPPVDVIDLRKMPARLNGLCNPLTYLECQADPCCGFAIELAMLETQVLSRPSMVRVRKKLARQFRRLGELAPVEFVVNPRGADLPAVTDALFAFKRDQYLRTFGHDLFALPGVQQFYREMAAREQLGRISHLSALTSGGKVVAAHLGFIGRRRFHYVMPSYDRRLRALAPGHLLLDHLVGLCAEGAFDVFDLGEGNFPYKHKWATQIIGLHRYEKPVTFRGNLYLEARRMRRRFASPDRRSIDSSEAGT